MLGGRPTIFISHSSKFKDQVAVPFRDHIESLGLQAILVEEMPHPAEAGPEPEAKVEYFLQGADMFVALLTPDDRIEGGEVRARANIADEIGRAKSLPHLRRKIQVFKDPEVVVHSNINPTREPLDIANPAASFSTFERQAVEWGVMPPLEDGAPTAATGPIGPADGEQPEGRVGDGAAEQAGAALSELRALLLRIDPDGTISPPLAIRRAHIAAATALTSLSSTSIYGVHELNGLHRTRADLQLSTEEVRHLIRSVIAHIDDGVAPGWYWLRGASAKECHEMLVDFALADPNPNLRAKSLKLLAKANRKLVPGQMRKLVEAGLSSNTGQIRRSALQLLAAKGDTRLLGTISAELGPDSAEAVLEVRSRRTPSAALRALVKDPYSHNPAIEENLLGRPKALPASTLRAGLTASFFRVQLLCLRGLDRTNRLRRADLDALLSHRNSKVRDEALRIACRRGWQVDQKTAEEIVGGSDLDFYATADLQLEYFRTLGRDALREQLKWIGTNGWNAYAALGLSGSEEAAERARVDLHSEFSAMRAQYRVEVRRSIEGRLFAENQQHALRKDKAKLEELIEQELNTFFGQYEDLDNFTLKRFQAAALRVLTEVGKPADASYARDLLFSNEHDVIIAAIRLLRRFGNSEDAARILDASGQLYLESRIEGVRAAVALASDKVAIATLMLESDDDDVRVLGIESLKETPIDQLEDIVLPLLDDRSDAIRAAATEQLFHRLSRTELRELIDAYPKRDYYYYNVIAGLDRFLYAPGWLRAAVPMRSFR
jgi:hypothetical protein